MKNSNLILTFLLLIFSYIAEAQLEKGSTMIGGTAEISLDFGDQGDRTFIIFFNPNSAVFVMDNFAVGGGLGLGYYKNGDYTSTSLSIFPLARYYFYSKSKETAFFVDGRIGYSITNFGFDNDKLTSSSIMYSFGPGVSFFLNDNVSVDGHLVYNHTGGDIVRSYIGLNIGLQVFLFKNVD